MVGAWDLHLADCVQHYVYTILLDERYERYLSELEQQAQAHDLTRGCRLLHSYLAAQCLDQSDTGAT